MSASSSQEVLWIDQNAKLPESCIQCGMFTDKRVKTTYVETRLETVESDDEGNPWLGCLLFLLGPVGFVIGLLLAATNAARKGGTKTKNVSVKANLKVPQCLLCKSERKVEPVDGDLSRNHIAFQAHPRFIRAYQSLNS